MSLFWTILIAVALGVTVGRWAIQALLALMATGAVSGAEAAARWPAWRKSEAGRTTLRKIERAVIAIGVFVALVLLVVGAMQYAKFRQEEERKERLAAEYWRRLDACEKQFQSREWCYSHVWTFDQK